MKVFPLRSKTFILSLALYKPKIICCIPYSIVKVPLFILGSTAEPRPCEMLNLKPAGIIARRRSLVNPIDRNFFL